MSHAKQPKTSLVSAPRVMHRMLHESGQGADTDLHTFESSRLVGIYAKRSDEAEGAVPLPPVVLGQAHATVALLDNWELTMLCHHGAATRFGFFQGFACARVAQGKTFMQNTTGKPCHVDVLRAVRGSKDTSVRILGAFSHKQMADQGLRYITSDAAPAGVVMLVGANPQQTRIVINSDEADAVARRLESGEAAKENTFYLQAWDTAGLDQLNSQVQVSTYRFGVPMHIYGQPSILLRLANIEVKKGLGFLQRFVFTAHALNKPDTENDADGVDEDADYLAYADTKLSMRVSDPFAATGRWLATCALVAQHYLPTEAIAACESEYLQRAMAAGDRSHPRLRLLDFCVGKSQAGCDLDLVSTLEEMHVALKDKEFRSHLANAFVDLPQLAVSEIFEPLESSSEMGIRTPGGANRHAPLPSLGDRASERSLLFSEKSTSSPAPAIDEGNDSYMKQTEIFKKYERRMYASGEAHSILRIFRAKADRYEKYGAKGNDAISGFIGEAWGKTRQNVLALTCALSLAETGAELYSEACRKYGERQFSQFSSLQPTEFDQRVRALIKLRREQPHVPGKYFVWDDEKRTLSALALEVAAEMACAFCERSVEAATIAFACACDDDVNAMTALAKFKTNALAARDLVLEQEEEETHASQGLPPPLETKLANKVLATLNSPSFFTLVDEMPGASADKVAAFEHLAKHGLGVFVNTHAFTINAGKAAPAVFKGETFLKRGSGANNTSKMFLKLPVSIVSEQEYESRLVAAQLAPSAHALSANMYEMVSSQASAKRLSFHFLSTAM